MLRPRLRRTTCLIASSPGTAPCSSSSSLLIHYNPSIPSLTGNFQILAPLARLLALNSTWPRLVATAGTSLTCGGILLIWPTINGNASNSSLFVLAGIFAGGGASIILAQVDILLLQYFKLKLELVRTIMYLGEAVGFIITPIALGHTIIQSDLLHIITWYQAILLQGVILSIAFRKPNYLKSASQRYRLIRGLSDEEEDVFAKNTTELQNPRASQMESGTPSVSNPPDAVGQNGTARHWETFDESTTPRTARTELHKTFAIEFSNDLDHNSHASFEDNYVPIPKPLFSESRINNNTSYSYEGGVGNEDPVVFMPNAAPAKNNSWEKILSVLKEPTFYKSLLFTITTRFAMFAFWTLFPTYLYIKIDRFKIHNTPSIVGALSVSSLMFSPALNWAKKSHKLRPLLIWIFCWMGAVGFLFFNEAGDETALIFGAVVITISLNACQILGVPLMNINNYGEHTVSYVLLCAITAISLLSLLAIDVNYRGCFGIVAVLEFVTGSVWLANYVYKKMKNIR
uniref:Major facilitator superfamily (MFS) profile domain-containing protein n=1 Tax=Photinus pyralis TaxID=7054 RepID=A0A1Y1KN00_PHOPY